MKQALTNTRLKVEKETNLQEKRLISKFTGIRNNYF